jgi:hypothetical protein
MNNKYKSFLFNGEIKDVENENLKLSPNFLMHPDLIPSKITELNNRVLDSADLLLKKMEKLEQEIIEWNKTEKVLGSLIAGLETKINDKLFLRTDTDGFFTTIEERMENSPFFQHRDLEVPGFPFNNDGIEYDSDSLLVRLEHSEDDANLLIPSNMYSIQASKAPFGGSEKVVVIPGSSFSNLSTSSTTGSWIASVITTVPKEVGIVLNISLSEPTKVGHVNLQVVNSSGGMSVSATAVDNDNNGEIVLDSATIAISNTINVNKLCKNIQVQLTKSIYDEILESGEYRYVFCVKSLALYNNVPGYIKSGTFYSKAYLPGSFSKIAIETCDFIEKDVCSIDYSILIGSEGFSEYSLNPLNRPPSANGVPYFALVLPRKRLNNFDNATTISSTATGQSFIPTSSIPNLYGFNNQFKALNFQASLPGEVIPNVQIFKNYKSSDVSNKDALEQDGLYYYTWIYVDKNENRTLDVGNSGITIEGFTVNTVDYNSVIDNLAISGIRKPTNYSYSNVINLDKTGWFKVKIPIRSYYSVGEDFENENELIELDPYYPYNAKYLIEGTNLDINPYKGFAKRAKDKVNIINDPYQVNYKNCYISTFVVVDPENGDSIQKQCILFLKDFDAKNCYVEYPVKDNNIGFFIVKARLQTSDNSITPIISSYKIKLGD